MINKLNNLKLRKTSLGLKGHRIRGSARCGGGNHFRFSHAARPAYSEPRQDAYHLYQGATLLRLSRA